MTRLQQTCCSASVIDFHFSANSFIFNRASSVVPPALTMLVVTKSVQAEPTDLGGTFKSALVNAAIGMICTKSAPQRIYWEARAQHVSFQPFSLASWALPWPLLWASPWALPWALP